MQLEVGKIYETRDGRLARVICVDRKFSENAPVIALITHSDGLEWTCGYNAEGVSPGDIKNDLVREHVPVTYRWHYVFKDGRVGGGWSEGPYLGEDDVGAIKIAFDPNGNLIPDKCEITAKSNID